MLVVMMRAAKVGDHPGGFRGDGAEPLSSGQENVSTLKFKARMFQLLFNDIFEVFLHKLGLLAQQFLQRPNVLERAATFVLEKLWGEVHHGVVLVLRCLGWQPQRACQAFVRVWHPLRPGSRPGSRGGSPLQRRPKPPDVCKTNWTRIAWAEFDKEPCTGLIPGNAWQRPFPWEKPENRTQGWRRNSWFGQPAWFACGRGPSFGMFFKWLSAQFCLRLHQAERGCLIASHIISSRKNTTAWLVVWSVLLEPKLLRRSPSWGGVGPPLPGLAASASLPDFCAGLTSTQAWQPSWFTRGLTVAKKDRQVLETLKIAQEQIELDLLGWSLARSPALAWFPVISIVFVKLGNQKSEAAGAMVGLGSQPGSRAACDPVLECFSCRLWRNFGWGLTE